MDDSIFAARMRRRSRRSLRRVAGFGLAAVLTGAAVGVAGAQNGDGGGSTASAAAVPANQAEVFVGLTPVRVLDTRPTDGGPIGAPAGKLGSGQSIDLGLVGAGRPLPAEATSAVLNVTLDQDASLKSYLTIWPKGENRPNASANNAEPGFVAANSMIAKLGADDAISIYNYQGATNVIIDVVGYLLPADQVSGLGTQFLVASGPPGAASGSVGDMYFDTASRDLYGPKSDSGWGAAVANLGSGGGGGSASTSTTTPAPGSPCSPNGQVNFNTLTGDVSVCSSGAWQGPVEIRSTIDDATSYEDSDSSPVDLGGTFVDVATFTAPAPGLYLLDAAVTVRQTTDDPAAALVNVQCRWAVGAGSNAGPVVSESFTAQTTVAGTPNTVFLGPKGQADLLAGGEATLQCLFDTDVTFLGDFEVQNWAYTATRTPRIT